MPALQFLLIYILPFLVLLTVVVTVHELGHFFAARSFGIAVDRFSIGFGKALFKRTDRSGVEWRVGWVPLGGYVRFSGDSNDASVPDKTELEDLRKQIEEKLGKEAVGNFYHFKPVWQRAIVAAAGPAANFILAVVIFSLVLLFAGERYLAPRIGAVSAGTAAAEAGFMPGDFIRRMDDKPLRSFDDLSRYVRLRSGQAIRFEVERGAQTILITATPRRTLIKDGITGTSSRLGQLGVGPSLAEQDRIEVRYNPVTATGRAVGQVGEIIGGTLTYLGRVFTARESGDQINGIVGIAQASGSVAKASAGASDQLSVKAELIFLNLVWLTAVLSVGIGFVNLMPVPMLDGGHLVFYAYEAVARRPMGANIQAAGYRVGLALVLGLMLFATWNDLQRLQAFQFLGGLFS